MFVAGLTAALMSSVALAPALGAETDAAAPHAKLDAPRTPSMWKERWPTYSPLEGFISVSAALGTLLLFRMGPVDEPRWTGGILFDDAVRDGLRADDPERRQAMRSVGDITYYAAPAIPFVIDVFVVALAIRRDTKLAFNMAFVNAESFAYSALLSFATTQISARERPDSTACLQANRGDESQCELDSRTESFISGHTMISATSAGVVCANHAYMPLWGHPAADVGACVLAAAAATTTGLSRIVADRHYATDAVLAGALGFGIGYAVPTLLHFTAGSSDGRIVAMPSVYGGHAGLSLGGTF